MIVLNEKLYAEECIENRTLGDKPYYTLTVLAKYYYHCFGYRRKKIAELLTDFMSKYYPRYSVDKLSWSESIDKIARNAGKYTLYEIDGVSIKKSEMKKIQSLKDRTLERLAFTMLCLAKLANLKNLKNNGWVNNDMKEIFTLARINCSVLQRCEKLGELGQRGMLEFPKKNDNLNNRVTFIKDTGAEALYVDDFRELGYVYLQYVGEKFIRCNQCGVLMRDNKNGTKRYCSNCAQYIPKRFKMITCVDCGIEFEVAAKNNRTNRCPACYEAYRNGKVRENMQHFREQKSMLSDQFLDEQKKLLS